MALIALTKDDKDNLKKSMLDYLTYSKLKGGARDAPLLIRAGLFPEAQKLISHTALKDEGFVKVCQGEIVLAKGQTAQAISLLEQGIRSLQPGPGGDRMFIYAGYESLAAAYEREGDLFSSLRVLKEALGEEEIGDPVFWLRDKAQLARLYRKLGRAEDAQKVEAELARLLAYADEDHPILRQLKGSQRLF